MQKTKIIRYLRLKRAFMQGMMLGCLTRSMKISIVKQLVELRLEIEKPATVVKVPELEFGSDVGWSPYEPGFRWRRY